MKPASWGEDFSERADGAAGANAEAGSDFDFVGMLFRRLWLIILGGILGVGLGYLYFTKQIPIYLSSARMLVIRERNSAEMPIRGIESPRIESDATATLVIRSPRIVADAVKTFDLANLPPFAGQGDPTQAIINGLGVTVAGGNGTILDLTYRGTDSQSCATILKGVISSYQSFLGQSHETVNEETTRLISDAKDNLLKQLDEKESAYRQFRQAAPLLWNGKGEEAQNIHQSRLTGIENLRSGLMITRTQTKAQIQSIEAAVARGDNREALLLMTGRAVNGDSGSSGTSKSPESQLFPLLMEEEVLIENHGPEHPKLVGLRRRIALTRKYLTRSLMDGESNETPDVEKQKRPQHEDFLVTYVKSLQQEINTSEEKERELNRLFETEREAAKSLAVFEVKDATYQADLKRTQQLFEGVVKRLEEINLMKNYGGFKTEVIAPAVSGVQIEPNRNRIMMFGLAAGIIGALALAFVAEISDRTFRNPEDISQQLRLPIVGHIPVTDRVTPKPQSHLDPTLVAFHQPKSRLAEAYRSIRTGLYFSTKGQQHRVIQITSPNPGDGKTTVSSNLAITIAQSGKKVLLIDADFRRPRIHKVFNLNQTLGMSSVISGDCDLPEAVQFTEVENLWIMPCGPRPSNPSELLSSPRFGELLQLLSEQYDFVLVDTPPMLAVTDPSVVAARVDGVFLTIRITKRTRAESIRATELLRALGANVLGVVVNGIGEKQGYGYGRYGASRYYQMGYRYRYGYGYDYGSREGGVYYSDEPSEQESASKV